MATAAVHRPVHGPTPESPSGTSFPIHYRKDGVQFIKPEEYFADPDVRAMIDDFVARPLLKQAAS